MGGVNLKCLKSLQFKQKFCAAMYHRISLFSVNLYLFSFCVNAYLSKSCKCKMVMDVNYRKVYFYFRKMSEPIHLKQTNTLRLIYWYHMHIEKKIDIKYNFYTHQNLHRLFCKKMLPIVTFYSRYSTFLTIENISNAR